MSARAQRLLARLWPGDFTAPRVELYAILDCARDPAIFEWIERSTMIARCLYSGEMPPALVRAAPYLVHVHAHVDPTLELLERGWGRSWGVFLHAPLGFDEVRRHLRRMLRVRDQEGRRLLFRYYDPRVLRRYLPSCTDEERSFVFGPVLRFLLEAEDGEGVDELARPEARPPPPRELVIRTAQLEALSEERRARFVAKMAAFLRERYWSAREMRRASLDTFVEQQLVRAERYGLWNELDASRYVRAAWMFGADFDVALRTAPAPFSSSGSADSRSRLLGQLVDGGAEA